MEVHRRLFQGPMAQAEQLVVKLSQDFKEFYQRVEHQSDPGALTSVWNRGYSRSDPD